MFQNANQIAHKAYRNHQNTTEMAPQIDPKSMKIQACETGAKKGAKMFHHLQFWGSILGSLSIKSHWNGPKGIEMEPKVRKRKHLKMDAKTNATNIRKICQKATKSIPKWKPNFMICHAN